MSVLLDHATHAVLSTGAVPERDAFAYWREMICAAFVKLRAERLDERRFRGSIDHVPVGELELSTVLAGAQHVERTRALISAASEEFVLASIQLAGRGQVEQDGRTALLGPGEMAFYDSTRPYVLHFDDPFRQLVVQVPRSRIDLLDTRAVTARTLGVGTPGAAVAAFFTALAPTASTDEQAGRLLVPHAAALLTAAASYAGGLDSSRVAADAMARQQVLDFMRARLADPQLDAGTIAIGCHVSRRTLYRIMGPDGVARVLRQLRLEQARQLLLSHPDRCVGAVAAACGFESESGFYRAFRSATGMTPAEYRQDPGTRRQ